MSLLPAFLSDSLDDVVFEGRNKAYGAYQLRQDYQQHLASAGGFTIMFCALLFLGWTGWKQLHPIAAIIPPHPVILTPIEVEVPAHIVIEKPKMALLTPSHAQPASTHPAPSTPTEVAKDDVLQPRITPPAPAETVDGPTGPVVPGTVAATDVGEIAGPSSTETGPATVSNEPFVAVEKMPEFAGGQEALLRYLRSHLRYPGAALAAGVGGKVFMSFVVGADGTISDVTILKGLGYGLDEEAQRVVRQMPAWTPGYQSKHPVPVRFTLPITFSIQ
jgi:protein TonB